MREPGHEQPSGAAILPQSVAQGSCADRAGCSEVPAHATHIGGIAVSSAALPASRLCGGIGCDQSNASKRGADEQASTPGLNADRRLAAWGNRRADANTTKHSQALSLTPPANGRAALQ